MQTENPDFKVIRPQPGQYLHNAIQIFKVGLLFLSLFIDFFLFIFSPLSLISPPPRHLCEDSLRAKQGESLCQHLSVQFSSTTSRTLQRRARGVASIRRSQWIPSSHEPWWTTHWNGQQYVYKDKCYGVTQAFKKSELIVSVWMTLMTNQCIAPTVVIKLWKWNLFPFLLDVGFSSLTIYLLYFMLHNSSDIFSLVSWHLGSGGCK